MFSLLRRIHKEEKKSPAKQKHSLRAFLHAEKLLLLKYVLAVISAGYADYSPTSIALSESSRR